MLSRKSPLDPGAEDLGRFLANTRPTVKPVVRVGRLSPLDPPGEAPASSSAARPGRDREPEPDAAEGRSNARSLADGLRTVCGPVLPIGWFKKL